MDICVDSKKSIIVSRTSGHTVSTAVLDDPFTFLSKKVKGK